MAQDRDRYKPRLAQDKISDFTARDPSPEHSLFCSEDSLFDLNSIELWVEDSFKDFAAFRLEFFPDIALLAFDTQKVYGTSHTIDLSTNTLCLCFTVRENGYLTDNSFIEFDRQYNFVDVLSNHPEGCYENYVEYCLLYTSPSPRD